MLGWEPHSEGEGEGERAGEGGRARERGGDDASTTKVTLLRLLVSSLCRFLAAHFCVVSSQKKSNARRRMGNIAPLGA